MQLQILLGTGCFQMGEMYLTNIQQLLEWTEVPVERSVCTVLTVISHLQLDGSAVECLILLILTTTSALIKVCPSCLYYDYVNCSLSYFMYLQSQVSVHVEGGATLTLGQSYILSCRVSGASVTAYHWRKDGRGLSGTRPILTFSPLRLSDAGLYTCEVTIGSQRYNASQRITIRSELLFILFLPYTII